MKTRCLCCFDGETQTYKQELRELLKITWPIALTQFLMFLPVFVSQSFCGHLGKEAIDGVALASTVINVSGMCVMLGLSSAVDTLFSQTLGSGNKEKVGIILQKGIWILLLSCLPCWTLFLNTGTILQSIGQDIVVSRIAGEYATIFMAGLPVYGINILLSKYMQVQLIVIPSLLIGIMINIMNAGLHALFIYVVGMETRGAALAATLTHWFSALLHVLFIRCKGTYKATWTGWSKGSLYGWGAFVKLAIPGLFMICMEYWGLEIIVLLSGLLGKVDLAANAIVYNIGGLIYMIVFGMSVAAGIRVGLFLGAGDSKMAHVASRVAMCCGSCFAVIIAVFFVTLKDFIPKLFSSNSDVLVLASSLLLQLALFKVFDTVQATCGGILRGIGLQAFGAVFNFFGYYIISLPISLTLMLATPLKVPGAYWGMIIGSFVVCVIYCVRIFTLDWEKETSKALKRACLEGSVKETDSIITHDEKQSIQMADVSLNEGSYKCYNSMDSSILGGDEIQDKTDNLSSNQRSILCKIFVLILFLLIFTGGVCVRILVHI
ncbi:multidrug and toxin extrusion protein 1-like [Saccostrea cucullata]|uniref:multidrug and toxin extrusion protein 1-like n=1 Tax=Saccostrea cuccullata TaxID=36930 RepID=UPI002ED337D4